MKEKFIITEQEYKRINFMDGDIHPMYAKMKKGSEVMYGSLMEGYMELEKQGFVYVG